MPREPNHIQHRRAHVNNDRSQLSTASVEEFNAKDKRLTPQRGECALEYNYSDAVDQLLAETGESPIKGNPKNLRTVGAYRQWPRAVFDRASIFFIVVLSLCHAFPPPDACETEANEAIIIARREFLAMAYKRCQEQLMSMYGKFSILLSACGVIRNL